MFKKLGAMLSFGKKRQSKIILKKNDLDAKNNEIFEEYFHRLPGFPQGIPVIPVEFLIKKNDELIKQIILARGMSGLHNKSEVDSKVMAPIRHLAEMTHLLPASDKKHFKLPGGLFTFCLEVSLFSIRYAERRILTRSTPEIRKEEESLWAHAAFLNGLFSEAITAISKLSVYAEDAGVEWHPGMESLFEWLHRNKLQHYHIRWSEKEDRSIIYMLAGKAIDRNQAKILVRGEKVILKTLLGALNDQTDFSNPLAKINETVRYKIMERDEWSYADRYGKPLAGMHLEPWLVDAMRHLVQKKRWVPNEDNGRIWHGQDGVFLVWPLAAGDMQYQLKAAECPFIPRTQEILADIMLDAGIIERNKLGGYLFDISIPVSESDERKYVEALKFARYEILFVKTQHEPIEGNLQIEAEEDNDDTEKLQPQSNFDTDHHSNNLGVETLSVNQDKAQTGMTESDSEEADIPESCFDTQLSKSNAEANVAVLFEKQVKPVIENKDAEQGIREENHDRDELIFTTNRYDDDYAADYPRDEEIGYHSIASLTDVLVDNISAEKPLVQLETPENNQVEALPQEEVSVLPPSGDIKTNSGEIAQKAGNKDKISIHKKPEQVTKSAKPTKNQPTNIASDNTSNEDLLDALMDLSKSKPKTNEKAAPEAKKSIDAEVASLFGKPPKTSSENQSGRAVLILDRLKKLPPKYLETRQNGITKVIGYGLKDTKLNMNDCVSVLKAADLLVLVDGYETALDSTGKPQSRYFLVKADLLHGK